MTLVLIVSFLISSGLVQAGTPGYPRLANYFLKTPIEAHEVEELAKWDVLILGMQAQDTNPEIFGRLRQLNPDIKLIAYLSAMEFPIAHLSDLESSAGPWHRMSNEIDWKWYLKDGSGEPHSIWPGNYSFNVTKYCPKHNGLRFNEWLPKFVKSTLMSSGKWDGVFYDNVLSGIKHTNNGQVDINNDYQVDDGVWADAAWREGMLTLLKNTREELGKNKIILVNSSSYGSEYINGRLYETWPDSWMGGWTGAMNDYQSLEENISFDPQIVILNPNTDNTGNRGDYSWVRFGLASALQGDGYFAFDFGTKDHSQLWRYDEYEVELGHPSSDSRNLLNNISVQYEEGVWRRDFANGVAIVNSTDQTQSFDLGPGIYEKIQGTQDPQVNDGSLVREITLAPQDGIILYNRLSTKTGSELTGDVVWKLKNVTFTNGDYVRVFDKRGLVKRTGFFAYDSRYPGGSRIVVSDIDADDSEEIVVAHDSKIQIFEESGLLINEFYPYGKKYAGQIDIAVGNIMGESEMEIVTGTGRGYGPLVKIFDNTGKLINSGWYAFVEAFKGGLNVELGDLNGNGYEEIVIGAGISGGPHVQIFDATGHLFDPGFFPYDPLFRGGVDVACADLNGDGKDEIITGAGPTGGPHIQIYDKIGHLVDPGFMAFSPEKRNGVKVGVGDIDGDGEVEILGME